MYSCVLHSPAEVEAQSREKTTMAHCGRRSMVGASASQLTHSHTDAMGKGFGELAYVRGIIKYTLSPFEQRAFAGAVSHGVPNMFRRFRSQVLKVAPPFIIGYMIYSGVEASHDQLMRKNPADYENDE